MRTDLVSTLTRRVLFAPLDAPGRADTVAERLRSAIALGVLAEGDLLPPESDLAAQFSISPVTLREALTQLRDQGVVATRRGRGGGTVVIQPQVNQVQTAREQVRHLSGLDLRDLADWRRAIVSESARLAARRASSEDIQLLARGCIRLAAAQDEAAARSADGRFVIELAAASQSVKLSSGLINLQVEYAPVLTLVYTDPALRSEVAGRLQAVMVAVRDGNQDEAQEQARLAVDLVAARAAELRTMGWSV